MTEDVTTKEAVQLKCVEQVLQLISSQAEEVSIESKNAAIIAAAAMNKTDAIQLLFEAGADVDDNTCDVTALSEAASKGNFQAVQVLLNHCKATVVHDIDQNGTTALRLASDAAHQDVVEYLLEKGADPFHENYCCSPLPMFAGSRPVLKILLANMLQKVASALQSFPVIVSNYGGPSRCGRIDLNVAFDVFIAHGHVEGLLTLLRQNVPCPSDALQLAVAFGQIEVLELLLAEGAWKTFDKKKERNFYGCEENRPLESMVRDAELRLEDTLSAVQKWDQMSSDNSNKK